MTFPPFAFGPKANGNLKASIQGFSLIPVLTTSTGEVAWPQGDQFLGSQDLGRWDAASGHQSKGSKVLELPVVDICSDPGFVLNRSQLNAVCDAAFTTLAASAVIQHTAACACAVHPQIQADLGFL